MKFREDRSDPVIFPTIGDDSCQVILDPLEPRYVLVRCSEQETITIIQLGSHDCGRNSSSHVGSDGSPDMSKCTGMERCTFTDVTHMSVER